MSVNLEPACGDVSCGDQEVVYFFGIFVSQVAHEMIISSWRPEI